MVVLISPFLSFLYFCMSLIYSCPFCFPFSYNSSPVLHLSVISSPLLHSPHFIFFSTIHCFPYFFSILFPFLIILSCLSSFHLFSFTFFCSLMFFIHLNVALLFPTNVFFCLFFSFLTSSVHFYVTQK